MMQARRPFGLLGDVDEDPQPAPVASGVFAGLLGSSPQALPDIEVSAPGQPGDDAHAFVQGQLNSGEPQLPQRDVTAEMDAYKFLVQHAPGSSTAKVFGALPDFKGGAEPGVAQELYNGDYKGALSDLLGLALTFGAGRAIKPILWPKVGGKPENKAKK
jgi:hypothetical protein